MAEGRSRLWPRYPGGAIAGALIGVASVVVFFIGARSLRSIVSVAVIVVIELWVLRSQRSDE